MSRSEVPILYKSVGLRVAAERSAAVSSLTDTRMPRADQDIFVDRNTLVVNRIARYVRERQVAVVEPYPLQLWGGDEDQRDTDGFKAGFNIINRLRDGDSARKIKYFALEDDMTNAPSKIAGEFLVKRREELYSSSSSVQESPFANPAQVGVDRVRRFTQSDLARSAGSNICSRVDAEFNYNKIVHQLKKTGKGGVLSDVYSLNRLLLVVVHPNDPWMMEQQLVTMQALFEKMRSRSMFQVLSRARIRQDISAMFRHVWIDREGAVTAVSRPAHRKDSSWVHERELL